MFVLKSDQIVFCDVDDTLVAWDTSAQAGELLEINSGDIKGMIRPSKNVVSQMRSHKLRGHKIVVWSRGGYKWAGAVVKAMQLESLVDVVMSKPLSVYDDLQPEDFMPRAQNLNKEKV